MKIILGGADPCNPNDMEANIVALCEMLSRFAEPDHRWLDGHKTVGRTGIICEQITKKPHLYTLCFFTSDDISVRAQFDMKMMLKDVESQVIGLMDGVAKYLVARRGDDLNILDEHQVERAVEAMMKKPEVVLH